VTAPPGWMRLDLHLHTRDSWDSLSDPEQVLTHGLERGLDRIAITDHNRIEVALEMAARHPEHVIPGEEVRTREGVDLIGLYLREEIPEGTPADEACRRIRAQGGVVYLPHPFAPGKGASGRHAERLAPQVHVVEVFNARLRSDVRNVRAAELAARHGLPGGAGSDAHTVGEVGSTWVEVPEHANRPEALLEAITRARIHGRRAPLRVFLGSNWAKVRKCLGRG
jgi:predicted metal-dependent phosphoesterase TrpH